MDLHMEHLNRECKSAIYKQSKLTERVGRCLQQLIDITSNFDNCTGVSTISRHHSKKTKAKDLRKVIK